jgi:hypothetical protein
MAIQRHRRSYVIYPRDYERDAPDASAPEFWLFAQARKKVLAWGDGSYIVEWIETFNKNAPSHDRTDREWIVRNGRLRKVLKKIGYSILPEN